MANGIRTGDPRGFNKGRNSKIWCNFLVKESSRKKRINFSATPVDSIKDVVRSSVKVPEFDKHLKKAGGHIGRNVVEITIKMKTIVRKPLMIKISLRVGNKSYLIEFDWLVFVSLPRSTYIRTTGILIKESHFCMTIVYQYNSIITLWLIILFR